MVLFSDLVRECRFLSKQRSVVLFLFAVLLLSVFAVWSGVADSRQQQMTIERLLEKDAVDRHSVLAKQVDYGDAAYYSFHFTYDEPSSLAFAAMGQRDVYPWKHRIRMLALEGQIHETDAENPELSLLGRFDFAFIISVLLPIFVILLLHDLRSAEREAGRYDLLVVTAKNQYKLWTARALVLSAFLAAAMLLPFLVGAVVMQAPLLETALMALIALGHLLFWVVLTMVVGRVMMARGQSSPRIASALLAGWLVLTVIVPVVGETVINQIVDSPKGGEIVLLQRQAVNDAWDKPYSATWDEFLKAHPEWAEHTEMESSFHWKWYYAFQQAGDQQAAELSQSYRDAIAQKDQAAGMLSLLSPPMSVQRLMSSLAETNVAASLAYEQSVRDHHQALRVYFYPLLFEKGEFNSEELVDIPTYPSHIAR
ncbi:DUF3526 domain-containing protein [Ferrimonas marina]|uniref:ABC-2 type transport system permease protein n=1 Tax=Ferrimonas marina TaxID=299255 RepID=A0A1M5N603_9GAMM|nr:DUF3526 domain-containing protein [Ferrimonas marina]SHG84862.1 ABC-2 type transport system permease protein [Ferrimonas marina]